MGISGILEQKMCEYVLNVEVCIGINQKVKKMADEVDSFNWKSHPWAYDLYNELVKKDSTRNDAIRSIKNSGFTELEKIILAINIGEAKANWQLQKYLKKFTTLEGAKKILGAAREK